MQIALWIVLILQASGPTIASEALGEGHHRMTITFSIDADQAEVQRLVDAEAARLCGSQFAHFGRYEFAAQQIVAGVIPMAVGQVVLRHELECRDEPPTDFTQDVAETEVGPVDTTVLQPIIDSLTLRFFTALDAGDYATALALTSPVMSSSVEDLAEGRRREAADIGSRAGARRFRTTWYLDHPDAPPGVFAAVDFGVRHQRGLSCGYVGWFRPAGESEFRMISMTTSLIPNSLDPSLSAAMRLQSRCVEPPPSNAV